MWMMTQIDFIVRNDLLDEKRESKEIFTSVIAGHDQCRPVTKEDRPSACDSRLIISFHITSQYIIYIINFTLFPFIVNSFLITNINIIN